MQIESPYPIAKRYKQLLLALIYSPIIAYPINAYLTFSGYRKHDNDLMISKSFLLEVAEYMLRDIELTFRFIWIPYVWPIVVAYLFVFYRVLISDKTAAKKYRTLLLTLLLVLFFIFAREYANLIASSS